MEHNEVQSLMDAYVDNELDLVSSLAIERHLRECQAGCLRVYQNRLSLGAKLKDEALYFRPTEDLQMRIQASLQPAGKFNAVGVGRRSFWIGLAAVLVVGFSVLFGITGLMRGYSIPTAEVSLTQQVVASHIRSLMVAHLADVASSDQHTVKPWFDGKLDYAPTVIDLADQGFPLIGGRLDYLDNRPVAALVYQYEKHTINLFIWPSAEQANTEPQMAAQQGYNIIHWTQANVEYWAVSDLENTKLDSFVRLIQIRAGTRPTS